MQCLSPDAPTAHTSVEATAATLASVPDVTDAGTGTLLHVLPFVLVNRLVADRDAPFFESEGNAAYRADRIGWIRRLFDLSCAQYDQQGLDGDDLVGAFLQEFGRGLDGHTVGGASAAARSRAPGASVRETVAA